MGSIFEGKRGGIRSSDGEKMSIKERYILHGAWDEPRIDNDDLRDDFKNFDIEGLLDNIKTFGESDSRDRYRVALAQRLVESEGGQEKLVGFILKYANDSDFDISYAMGEMMKYIRKADDLAQVIKFVFKEAERQHMSSLSFAVDQIKRMPEDRREELIEIGKASKSEDVQKQIEFFLKRREEEKVEKNNEMGRLRRFFSRSKR